MLDGENNPHGWVKNDQIFKKLVVFLNFTGYNDIKSGGGYYGCIEKRGNLYDR